MTPRVCLISSDDRTSAWRACLIRRMGHFGGDARARLAWRRYQRGQGRLVAARAVVRPSVDEQRRDELAMRLLVASEGYTGQMLVTLGLSPCAYGS